jgi:poly(hydroxyalkanoate) depolymerase family esterase
MKLDNEFLAQMREATQLLQNSGPAAATAAIQRALHGAAPSGFAPQPEEAIIDINAKPAGAGKSSAQPKHPPGRFREAAGKKWWGAAARQPIEDVEDVEPAVAGKGRFLSASCTNHAGTRAYKIHVPSGYQDQGQPLPLIVMLHGCKQDPDDFAAGTGMNAVAEEHNCFVVYPGQIQAANGSNCWNWFQHGDQQRDKGEPSIIADITRAVMREYRIDPGRVYVAGLSAGGAMAAIMGARYPDLYAAVGVHSGLPVGVAHDMPSAFAAMGNGAGPLKPKRKPRPACQQAVPVIVFHGDRDATVHPRNGDQCTEDFLAAHKDGCDITVENGTAAKGRSYTRTIRRDRGGNAVAEHWVVHGAGHAWSGGSRRGSFTDPSGPDASREMMRFFLSHGRTAR